MSRLSTVLGGALILAGCLSGPSPLDENNQGDAGSDASVDPGMSFPGGHDINLRDVFELDVDGDGPTDLVLINSSSESEDRGVFVLRGPQGDAGDLRYHQHVNTLLIPYHAVFENIVGGTELDLIVLGVRDGAPTAVIEIYEQAATGEFTRVISRIVDGFEPDPNLPITISVGAFNGAVINDFVVADLATMLLFLIDDATIDLSVGLANANPVALSRAGTSGGAPFEGINGVLALTLDGGADDLLVIENFDVHWFENDSSGGFAPNPTANNSMTFPIRTFDLVDLDDQIDDAPPLDIVGGGLVDFGAWFLDANGPTVSLESADWDVGLVTDISDIAAGNLNEGLRPEVALFFPNPTGPGGELLYYVDARRNGAVMAPTTPLSQLVTVSPDRGVITDFDNNGSNELWAFDIITGEALCAVFVDEAPALCDE